MASSMNKSKNRGLRILWIPKKHNRKGRIESTNKNVDYSRYKKQPKNEMWSLGRDKSHQDFESNLSKEVDDPSSVVNNILPASCAVGIGLQNTVNMKPVEEGDEFQISEIHHENLKDLNKSSKIQNYLEGEINKKALFIDGEKIQKSINSQDDINSIEITENGNLNLNNDNKIDLDTPDGSFKNLSKSNGKKKSKKKKKKNKINEENNQKEDEDDAAVKCLYYTLMCCECTIS